MLIKVIQPIFREYRPIGRKVIKNSKRSQTTCNVDILVMLGQACFEHSIRKFNFGKGIQVVNPNSPRFYICSKHRRFMEIVSDIIPPIGLEIPIDIMLIKQNNGSLSIKSLGSFLLAALNVKGYINEFLAVCKPKTQTKTVIGHIAHLVIVIKQPELLHLVI